VRQASDWWRHSCRLRLAPPCRSSDNLSVAFPLVQLLLTTLNVLVSLALFTLLFGAIYTVLPESPIAWRDVAMGSFFTAALFTAGKSLIGWYLGRAAPSGGYGAAGALSQIFLFGPKLPKRLSTWRARRIQIDLPLLCTHSISGGRQMRKEPLRLTNVDAKSDLIASERRSGARTQESPRRDQQADRAAGSGVDGETPWRGR
jgi:hypothetical protein